MGILNGQIELKWPGKDCQIHHNGKVWEFTDNLEKDIRSLIYDSTIGNDKDGECKGYAIKGDLITALEGLAPYTPSSLQMVYFDSPRLSVLQEETIAGFVDSTWLSIVYKSALLATKVLKKSGFFVLHTDEEMSHYGRMVLDDVFGRDHHITTFAWQKKYAPQNDKGKKNPTDVYDYIIVYSKARLDEIAKIGLIVKNTEIIDDGDWRGCYIAGHKGAKSGSEATKFKVNASPYHWEIVESNLPDGKYWFDRILGVLWFDSIDSIGNYWVKVRATDREGNQAEDTIHFVARNPRNYTEEFELPKRIWWLIKNDNDIVSKGNLQVVVEDTPEAIKGCQYSLIFKAKGGTPITMKNDSPGEGRFWEFAQRTLVEAIATTNASFGKKGVALPSIKTYYDRDNSKKLKPVMNWLPWYEFGKSEDATRHIKKLAQAGITKTMGAYTAKPQKLLYHLISLLAPNKNDVVLSIGDSNGVFASVAIKSQHKFIHLTGGADREIEAWVNVGSSRLVATIDNKDCGKVEEDDSLGIEYNVSKGYIDVLCVSKTSLKRISRTGNIIPIFSETECIEDFYAGLVGGYRKDYTSNIYSGLNGDIVIVLDSDDILDSSYLSKIGSTYPGRVKVVAERCEELKSIPKNVTVLHAPYELISNYD